MIAFVKAQLHQNGLAAGLVVQPSVGNEAVVQVGEFGGEPGQQGVISGGGGGIQLVLQLGKPFFCPAQLRENGVHLGQNGVVYRFFAVCGCAGFV